MHRRVERRGIAVEGQCGRELVWEGGGFEREGERGGIGWMLGPFAMGLDG